jgi:hypothetical protein
MGSLRSTLPGSCVASSLSLTKAEMRWAARSNLFFAALLVASCDRSSGGAGASLVGAEKRPPESQLLKETIEIVPSSAPGPRSANLYYDLRPDNSLSVTLSHWTPQAHGEVVDGRDTFQLSASEAGEARRLLWRLRPERLAGVESDIQPVGCRPAPVDASPLYSVAFIAEGAKPGLKDDLIGVTGVPAERDCNTQPAADARQLVQQVLQIFPMSKVAAEFERRKNRR